VAGGLWATQQARKHPAKAESITRLFAWALVGNVLVWQIIKVGLNYLEPSSPAYVSYKWGEDLPLNPCNWLAFVALAYSYTKKEWLWHLLYFFVWVFTFNAVITPSLYENFPHFTFCKFWIAHTGLVMLVIHLNRLNAPKIEFKHLIQAYLYLQVFTAASLGINALIGPESNYFFLSHKPFSASVLDILGEWPFYIIQGDVIAFGLFVLAWLPYRFLSHRKLFRVSS
jgi:hypothetical integral membrane protein (TIGR02206 family)